MTNGIRGKPKETMMNTRKHRKPSCISSLYNGIKKKKEKYKNIILIMKTYLSSINDYIDGAVNRQHEMVPPSEVVCPPRPELDCTIMHHLYIGE